MEESQKGNPDIGSIVCGLAVQEMVNIQYWILLGVLVK